MRFQKGNQINRNRIPWNKDKKGVYVVATGQRFGRLTIIEKAYSINGCVYVLCLCSCGNKKEIIYQNVLRGNTKSCGCYAKEVTGRRATRHGYTKMPLYLRWTNMISRCYNKKNKCYERYGGRGIKVSEEWQDFLVFNKDMFESYVEHIKKFGEWNTTIERINNYGNYSKENCCWATHKEQCLNRRKKRTRKEIENEGNSFRL